MLALSLIQSTGSVNLNLTCYHISESLSNFAIAPMPVWYCASDQLKVGEGSHKFAPVIATGGYQEVHNVIGQDISVPFSGTLNSNSIPITSEC